MLAARLCQLPGAQGREDQETYDWRSGGDCAAQSREDDFVRRQARQGVRGEASLLLLSPLPGTDFHPLRGTQGQEIRHPAQPVPDFSRPSGDSVDAPQRAVHPAALHRHTRSFQKISVLHLLLQRPALGGLGSGSSSFSGGSVRAHASGGGCPLYAGGGQGVVGKVVRPLLACSGTDLHRFRSGRAALPLQQVRERRFCPQGGDLQVCGQAVLPPSRLRGHSGR